MASEGVSPHKDPAGRRIYSWLAFHDLESRRKAKNPWLHMTRDGGPAQLIGCVLGSAGYSPGPIIFNYPGHDFGESDPSLFDRRELLLVTTRPPLDPYPRKRIDCSNSPLERKIFCSFRRFFAYCSRDTVELTCSVEQALSPNKKYLARIDFDVFLSGSRADDPSQTDQRGQSLGYMVSTVAAWPDGPRLLAAFSTAGTESLAWGYILTTKHRELLERAMNSDRDMIAIGEFTLPNAHLDRRGSLRFLDEVDSVVTVCEL